MRVLSWIGAAVGGLAAAVIVVLSATVQIATAEPVDETRAVIAQQLDAFQRDAWDEAYAFAAPGVKRSFPTVDSFSQMVRQGYPMVWRPSDVEFLGATEERGLIWHRLRLIGPDGGRYIATYILRDVDGAC